MSEITDGKIHAMENRRRIIRTDDGRRKAEQYMIGQFEYLRMCGYKIPDTDYRVMARVWVDQLADYIVMYGFSVVTEALKEYVASDNGKYRQMPNPAQIIAICKERGKNPIAEAERKKLDAFAERMKAEADAEAKSKLDDKTRAEFMRKYPSIAEVIKGCTDGD